MMTETLRNMSVGMKVFTAIDNWDRAGFFLKLKVMCLGKREIIEHIGFGHKIAYLDGVPYHLSIWEL